MSQPWSVEFLPAADKDLISLDKVIRQSAVAKIEWFTLNFTQISPERLSNELSDYYKLRVGDYRVVYKFDGPKSLITVFRIGRRDKVYKLDLP